MSKTDGLIIFALGAAVGSIATWKFAKKILQEDAQEELDSLKKDLKRDLDSVAEKIHTERKSVKTDISRYDEILEEEKYAANDESSAEENRPYVISPDDFGEIDDYEQISLTYYADDILADENDEIIKNTDDVVGVESLAHFGEYEDDSVFVRNDRLKCDFEILLDTGRYSEVLKHKPHKRES